MGGATDTPNGEAPAKDDAVSFGEFVGGLLVLIGMALALAVFKVVGSIFVYPVFWILSLTKASFFTFVLGEAMLSLVLPGAIILVSLLLVAPITYYAALAVRMLNRHRIAFLKTVYPVSSESWINDLRSRHFYVVFVICTPVPGIALVTSYITNLDLLTLIISSAFVVTLVIYSGLIIRLRELGIWAFYEVRSLAMPYVLIMFPCVYLEFVIIISLTDFLSKEIGVPIIETIYVIPETQAAEAAPDVISLVSARAAEAVGLGAAFCIFLIWVVAVICKRQFGEIIVFAMFVSAPISVPWIRGVADPLIERIQDLLEITPKLFQSVAIAIAIENAYGWVSLRFKNVVECPRCQLAMSVSDRYCRRCGSRNPAAHGP